MLFRPLYLTFPFDRCSDSLDLGIFITFSMNNRKKENSSCIHCLHLLSCLHYLSFQSLHYFSSIFLYIYFLSYSSVSLEFDLFCCHLINVPALLSTGCIVILHTLLSQFSKLLPLSYFLHCIVTFLEINNKL